MFKIVFATVLMLLSPAAVATPLFQGTSTDMTVSEVLTTVPDAKQVHDPESGFGPLAPCLARIDNYTIGARRFEVCFIFENERLKSVMMRMIDKPLRLDYNDLVNSVRSKYGPEIGEAPSELGRRADWVTKDGTDISINWFNNSLLQGLNIVYSAKAASEAGKL
ncbi:hypothetical protein [Sphingomonas sp. 3-13AW]|uniref:hypothetical protein n=1 Tax=Sphingomonas sp. 3-13AW TaxID=3050450 RepID=UPI003BB66DF7